MSHNITRRQFLKNTALASSIMIIPRHVLGSGKYTAPSDKIQLGFIGTGRISRSLQNRFLESGQVNIVAACDVHQTNLHFFLKRFHAYHYEQAGKTNASVAECAAYKDFRELLDRQDLDGVVISTPDHWHAIQAVRAAEAGKDIYCEKPLALSIKEGRAMVQASQEHQRIFQTGSMQRSWHEFRHAVELVRNGYIGELQTIKVKVGGPPEPYDLPAEPVPKGLDWDFWLGPNPYFHYNRKLVPEPGDDFWAEWRYYQGLGGGYMMDWGTHMFDIAQWALDMDMSGPVKITPPNGEDYQYLTYQYENGLSMTHENFSNEFGNIVRFIGSEGIVDVARGHLETTPEHLKDVVISENENRVYKSENHYTDWLNAIRSRKDPICNAETGHRTATVCILGNLAYELNRPLRWNPETEQFLADTEANSMLMREQRKKWAL